MYDPRLESLEMTLASLTHERDSLSEDKALLEQNTQKLEAELVKWVTVCLSMSWSTWWYS